MHGAVAVPYSLLERVAGGSGGGQGSFETGCLRSRGKNNFGCSWTRGWGVSEIRQFSWTSCVSSLKKFVTLDGKDKKKYKNKFILEMSFP